MKQVLCLFFILVVLFAGCSQSNQNEVTETTHIKIILGGEEVILTKPALLKNDNVYISLEDMDSLPGIKITYNESTGEITAMRNTANLTMQLGQPLKPGDNNGPSPFLNQGVVYLPLRDAIQYLEYNSQQETSPDETIVITLIKLGFDISDLWHPFSTSELSAAEAALAAGVTILDPQGDWASVSEGIQPDGRTDNTHPYPLDFTDVKSVTFGADSQYLYLKVELYDVIPNDVVYWDNTELQKQDFISGMGCNLALMHFFNRNIGRDDTGLIQLGLSYIEGNIWTFLENPVFYTPPVVAISNFATPSGNKDNHNEDIYLVSNSEGRVGGGAGTNYFMAAFPLSNFGLQLGDTIEFNLALEVGSLLFHHECVDVILDCGFKTGETIRYQLGANTYENLGPPNL